MLLAGDERGLRSDRPASGPQEGLPWRPLSPLSIEAPHVLSDVAASSPEDVWVVGQAHGRPLAARWDGTSWSVPPGPPPSAALIGAGLEGVAAARTGHAVPDGSGPAGHTDLRNEPAGRDALAEVIAVGGAYDRLLGTEIPLIRHWDGTGWAEMAAPALPDADSAQGYVLTDVTMVAPAEAWAVGHGSGRGNGLVALHWHHDRWHPAGLPDIAQGKLLAVCGTSPWDVWAVGAADRAGLVVHYDGRAWQRIRTPATRFPLTDVTAVSPDDAWCAGGGSVLRWNGRKWSRVKTPIESANTVTAVSATDVWVGGAQGELAHFDGHRWTWMTAPGDLHGTAVWRSSTVALPTSAPGAGIGAAVWMVGSRRLGGSVSTPQHRSFTSQSGEG
ncbi:hypothetical protein SAMN04489712_11583 [Thermomonospora echinospora]|uniref:Uncharacterized protein n=2 Tax=Thermomonospora echinospora TaxID=1992 RepID=A0A1H6DBW4_9ACTN|nr:hypothetical protein SAMN04489712_11583 [Thermomonospora echinospora]